MIQRHLAAILPWVAAFGGLPNMVIRERREPQLASCLECGTPKRHNNSFCSAECCRIYREKNKK